jgi:hypothetical protein
LGPEGKGGEDDDSDDHDAISTRQVLAMPGAIRAMQTAGESPLKLLRRHARGDFGAISTTTT